MWGNGNVVIKGDGNADNRGDGNAEMEGDGNAEMEGDGSVECTLKAGELKRVEGGSDGGSIWVDLEPDGNIPGTSVAPDHPVSYGEYRCFFGDSASSVCAACCISGGWFGHNLR